MLFGRVAECARIERLLAETRRGASGAVAVSGDPGVGKTSLLKYAADAGLDLRVLPMTGVEAEAVLPFAALGRLLSPVLEHLESVPAPLAATLRGALAMGRGTPGDPLAASAATLQLLAAAAENSPIVVLVDDAQWVDQPTADVLAFVTRRLRAEGIAMIVATRDVAGFAGLELMRIDGLDERSVAEFLTARLAAVPSHDVVNALTARLAGNPLALSEVADSLTVAQLSGRRPLPLVTADATADQIFGPRVGALDLEPRRALSMTAVAAGDGLAVLLAALAAHNLDANALESLEDSGLVTFSQGEVRFAHPLVRTAALADLNPAQVRALHLNVATVLTESTQAERRAWHLAEAAFAPDEGTARELEHAANLALGRSGYGPAALAFERAAELSTEERSRARRFFAAAEAARIAGRGESALELLTKSESHTSEPVLLAVISGARGRIELHAGRPAVAQAVWEAGAAAIIDAVPIAAATFLAAAGAAAYAAGDAARAGQLALEAALLGGDDRNLSLTVKVVAGSASGMMGLAYEEGIDQLRAAAS